MRTFLQDFLWQLLRLRVTSVYCISHFGFCLVLFLHEMVRRTCGAALAGPAHFAFAPILVVGAARLSGACDKVELSSTQTFRIFLVCFLRFLFSLVIPVSPRFAQWRMPHLIVCAADAIITGSPSQCAIASGILLVYANHFRVEGLRCRLTSGTLSLLLLPG